MAEIVRHWKIGDWASMGCLHGADYGHEDRVQDGAGTRDVGK